MVTTDKAYFELCDGVYNTWKLSAQAYFETVKPYWESLHK
jgi:hypothetical protein